MKKFRISVNGSSYDVEVEELSGGSAPAAKPAPAPKAQPKAKKAAPKAKKPAPKPKKAAPAGGHSINAPMPGTVLSVKVSEGDSVSDGDVLLVLEAMKMENEIAADIDGTVASVMVNDGDSVDSGEVLIVIE